MALLQKAELSVIDSVWGHVGEWTNWPLSCMLTGPHNVSAGGSANPADVAFVTAKIKTFLG